MSSTQTQPIAIDKSAELWRANKVSAWSKLSQRIAAEMPMPDLHGAAFHNGIEGRILAEMREAAQSSMPHLASVIETAPGQQLTLTPTDEKPILIDWRNTASHDSRVSAELYVPVSGGGVYELIEIFSATQNTAALYRNLRIDVGPDTVLKHWVLEIPSTPSATKAHSMGGLMQLIQTHVQQSASLQRYYLGLGTHSKTTEETFLVGAHASANQQGVFLPSTADSEWDIHSHTRHQAEHTRSGNDFRGIASGGGTGIWNSIVTIEQGADFSDSQQLNHNIVQDTKSHIHTKPELIIFTDEVTASHGSTCGALDKEALFFLQSRGIPYTHARAMMIDAFLMEAMPPEHELLPVSLEAAVRSMTAQTGESRQ